MTNLYSISRLEMNSDVDYLNSDYEGDIDEEELQEEEAKKAEPKQQTKKTETKEDKHEKDLAQGKASKQDAKTAASQGTSLNAGTKNSVNTVKKNQETSIKNEKMIKLLQANVIKTVNKNKKECLSIKDKKEQVDLKIAQLNQEIEQKNVELSDTSLAQDKKDSISSEIVFLNSEIVSQNAIKKACSADVKRLTASSTKAYKNFANILKTTQKTQKNIDNQNKTENKNIERTIDAGDSINYIGTATTAVGLCLQLNPFTAPAGVVVAATGGYTSGVGCTVKMGGEIASGNVLGAILAGVGAAVSFAGAGLATASACSKDMDVMKNSLSKFLKDNPTVSILDKEVQGMMNASTEVTEFASSSAGSMAKWGMGLATGGGGLTSFLGGKRMLEEKTDLL